jgi:hypothetical protein
LQHDRPNTRSVQPAPPPPLAVIKTWGFDEVQRLLTSDGSGGGSGGSSLPAPAAAAAAAADIAAAAPPARRRWGISQHRHLALYALGRYAVQAPPVPPAPSGVVAVLRWVDATLLASLEARVLPALAAAPRDEALLTRYAAAWQTHVLTGEWLRRVFPHADTVYVDAGDGSGIAGGSGSSSTKQGGGGGGGSASASSSNSSATRSSNGSSSGSGSTLRLGPTLTTRAARLWRAVVFMPLQRDLVRALVAATNAEREGAAVNR